MFDVGMGELLILAVIGLLVFGPERLPRAAADAARMLRNVKAMASTARKDLADASGLDMEDTKQTLAELKSYHPKNLMSDLFSDNDDDEPVSRSKKSRGSATFDPDAT
jgi:sec-independent protein translocase protein TatB